MKCRYFAVAKLRSTEDAEEPSSLMVGIQGLSDAIDCRKRSKGSWSGADMMSNSIDAARYDILCGLLGKEESSSLVEGELLHLARCVGIK